jgi:hypothetical protein
MLEETQSVPVDLSDKAVQSDKATTVTRDLRGKNASPNPYGLR